MTEVIRVYEERMRAANAMDFDDLLCNLLALLEKEQGVRERLQGRCRWLLVDEYQDTNTVQYSVLRQLAGAQRNVCATGDPDQSIYRWRGATLRNILDFERDFPGAAVVTLDRNYRSTKAILAVANAVIRHNLARYEKELVTHNAQGALVREVRCRDDMEEAHVVAREILGWIDRGRRCGDLAVFYRVNAQSRTLEKALRERGVPYRIVGSVEFYKRREVKDVLAYARLARNPLDGGALRRILNVPPRGLGARTEERLFKTAFERAVPVRDLLRDPAALEGFGRARGGLLELGRLLDGLGALPLDPRLFLEGVLEATAYRAYLGAGGPHPEVERIENVDELINAAAEYARREPSGGIDGFLEENALVSDQDTYDAAADAVVLMTVHSAKGLEFPCVVVTGLEEKVFPHALSYDSREEIEEERRLFYVACTRAKEELVLTHAAVRLRQGSTAQAVPSRFLDEIPDPLLSVEDLTRDPYGVREGEPVFDVHEDTGGAFREGDRVRHHLFGRGCVAAVRSTGGGTRVTVDFEESGRRELSLSFARLERL
jgi:DNA helicase-2/ATP-dependent DNA helicase PcrA